MKRHEVQFENLSGLDIIAEMIGPVVTKAFQAAHYLGTETADCTRLWTEDLQIIVNHGALTVIVDGRNVLHCKPFRHKDTPYPIFDCDAGMYELRSYSAGWEKKLEDLQPLVSFARQL